ncbi:MAG: DJ-1/PfpI family protein [Gordonia sp. (in: high G+C Gram-positive bacteria)]
MCHYSVHQTREIAVLVDDGIRTLDVAALIEVIDVAKTLGYPYDISLYSISNSTSVECSSGLRFATAPISACPATIDTLVVVSSDHHIGQEMPQQAVDVMQSHAASSKRTAGVAGGAFVLAAAGLLDGRRATTHWRHLDELAARHPTIRIERDSVFVRDGSVWTSAGAAAGVDLALAFIADDHGADVAHEISKDMVLLSRRMEGHPQISAAARAPRPKHSGLERLMATISADPAGHYELDTVAADVGMSPRHLARLFKAQTGVTLRQYVYEVRLENAVDLVHAGESFTAAAKRSGLRYGARIRDHLVAHQSLATAEPVEQLRYARTVG